MVVAIVIAIENRGNKITIALVMIISNRINKHFNNYDDRTIKF